ncbi:hypothetical protein [Pseudoalteromonas luteoviolacea]|uniref:Uncharacterized protein containing a NRPS condensation (Elongation) domain protein n=1 Tax=Pseudoalteromonas luteoviolacea (strain 2ta16) TaxID=1353533 RepID=V4HTW2_PSEL2|nr:hypothetical protein [Pseudoalteromonas luteoviolacea]ESP93233.1 uncharacterized protein containing a NRPS condensation (elongation) domain protein [Pseudoalteromonas luteoviolacea 2ta16]KZN36648.1 hypothetical protein N483_22270 [Pseudoalteromonas luteoviolacea NCIMB 1944]
MNLLPLSDRSLNFIALAAANKNNANSCDLAILEGHYDIDVLTECVNKIASTHPIMQSRVVKKGFRYYWQFDAQLYPEKRFLDWSEQYSNVEQWHAALRQFVIDNPIDPFNGSGVAFVYVKFRSYSALMFLSSHAVSDARSGYILFEQLHALLTDQPIPNQDNSFCEDHLLFDSVTYQAMFKAAARLACELFKAKKTIPIKASGQWQIDYHDLGVEATESVLAWARKYQFSANVVLNYVFNKVLNNGKKYTMIETMSVRALSSRNLSSSYNNLILSFGSDIGGDSNWMQAYQSRLNRLKSGDHTVHQAEQRLQSLSINLMPRRGLKLLVDSYKRLFLNGNVILSNLGKLEFDLKSIGKCKIIDIYNFSVPLPPAGLAIVVSTYQGRLRISYAHEGGDITSIKRAVECEIASLNE